MMKRTIALMVFVSALAATAVALDWSDPRDEIYSQLDMWAARGYVSRLPLLRPYPQQLVASLLREVARNGDRESVREAGLLLGEVDAAPRITLEAYSSTSATQDAVYNVTGAFIDTRGRLTDLITMSGRAGGLIVVEPGAEDAFLPGERFPVDYVVDYAAVSVRGVTLLPTGSASGTAAMGTDRWWLQIGLNRHSFGPFDEGPVLSPQAMEAGHLSFTWRGERLTYSEFLLMLGASSDRGDALGDDGKMTVYPRKYLTGQSFQFSPFDWLDLGLFETIVYGERFEPLYLTPLVPRIYMSAYLGSVDNLMLGFSASARLPSDLSLDLMFYADDLQFLDMLALDFDTKYKVSGQAGISWTPLRPLLKRVSLDYALVTPYTYTHRRASVTGQEAPGYANDINYYNYSHMGRSLVALDPDSDRVRLRALLTPMERLGVTLSASYQRHANATGDNLYGTNTYATGTSDGGINDNGYVEGGDNLFDTVSFLSHGAIEQILLLGFDASWKLPLDRATLYVEGGYTMEVARNKREIDPAAPAPPGSTNGAVPIEGNDVVLHHISLGLRYAY